MKGFANTAGTEPRIMPTAVSTPFEYRKTMHCTSLVESDEDDLGENRTVTSFKNALSLGAVLDGGIGGIDCLAVAATGFSGVSSGANFSFLPLILASPKGFLEITGKYRFIVLAVR